MAKRDTAGESKPPKKVLRPVTSIPSWASVVVSMSIMTSMVPFLRAATISASETSGSKITVKLGSTEEKVVALPAPTSTRTQVRQRR